jgi:hypothetical protein
MAVNQVILQSFAAGKLQNLVSILLNMLLEDNFRKWMLRACRDVSNPVAKTKVMQYMRYMLVLGAGEDIQLNAFPTKVERQIPNVDIHTAGIFPA